MRLSDPAHPTDLDRMRVAFAIQVAQRISEADGILDLSEIEFLMRLFPDSVLRACGFLDEQTRLTDTARAWSDQARTALAKQLTTEQKLELVSLFHEACMVDGEMHPSEIRQLMQAAGDLGLSRDVVFAHIGSLRHS